LLIDGAELRFVGRDLKRPECVLCMPAGRLYVAHRGGGILRIETDGAQSLLKWQQPADAHDFIPNGFALLPDGTFLVANMAHGGGVWARRPGGRVEPYLMTVDGVQLAKANFVFIAIASWCWDVRYNNLSSGLVVYGASFSS
jgi:hypothetical protein